MNSKRGNITPRTGNQILKLPNALNIQAKARITANKNS
jgi:hypothetical protein